MKNRHIVNSVTVLLLIIFTYLMYGLAYTDDCVKKADVISDTVDGTAITGKNWLRAVPDDTLIGDINIPGVHDAGAEFVSFPEFGRCQDSSIPQLLENGFRYFDVRLAVSGDKLIFMHGFLTCKTGPWFWSGTLTFDEVLKKCYRFLEENPSETIIMVIKQEYGNESTGEFQRLVNEYIEARPERWFTENRGNIILSEARGKIVFMRRFDNALEYPETQCGVDVSWSDQGNTEDQSLDYNVETRAAVFAVQDRYKYTVENKKAAVEKIFTEPEKYLEECDFCISHTSLASGTLPTPYRYKKTLRDDAFNYNFTENTGKIGWVVVDFGNAGTANKIYMSNFD